MTGTAIANINETWAAQADAAAQSEPLSGSTFLSTRGGVLSFGEDALPGNQCAVIVLDSVRENTLYEGEFDAEQVQAPRCYAFGRADEEMAPHPTMQSDLTYFMPQAETCAACQFNEWGSAEKGRGKACQNRRRLTLIPAGYYLPKAASRDFDLHLFDDPKHYQTADMAFMKLPVTSVKDWAKYVTQVSATLRRPPHGVITRIYLEPDPKSQYRVKFEVVEEVSDELAAIVIARHEAAIALVPQGYSAPDPEAQANQPARGIRGLRR